MGTFVAGYTIVWLSLVLYVGWMGRRHRRLAQQYEGLRQQIENAEWVEEGVAKAA